MPKWAVAHGEMFDAINFFGPFDEFEDAEVWADRNCDMNWWLLMLEDIND